MASESWLDRKLNPEPQLDPGEQIVWKRPAIAWRGRREIGGTLYLTDRNLRFNANLLNLPGIRRHQETYSLASIVHLEIAGRPWTRSEGGFHRRMTLVRDEGTSVIFGVGKGLLDETIADLSTVVGQCRR